LKFTLLYCLSLNVEFELKLTLFYRLSLTVEV